MCSQFWSQEGNSLSTAKELWEVGWKDTVGISVQFQMKYLPVILAFRWNTCLKYLPVLNCPTNKRPLQIPVLSVWSSIYICIKNIYIYIFIFFFLTWCSPNWDLEADARFRRRRYFWSRRWQSSEEKASLQKIAYIFFVSPLASLFGPGAVMRASTEYVSMSSLWSAGGILRPLKSLFIWLPVRWVGPYCPCPACPPSAFSQRISWQRSEKMQKQRNQIVVV